MNDAATTRWMTRVDRISKVRNVIGDQNIEGSLGVSHVEDMIHGDLTDLINNLLDDEKYKKGGVFPISDVDRFAMDMLQRFSVSFETKQQMLKLFNRSLDSTDELLTLIVDTLFEDERP